jgi:hypothetical protein
MAGSGDAQVVVEVAEMLDTLAAADAADHRRNR